MLFRDLLIRNGQDKILPLDNLKVVDFSRIFSGPLCTMLLADYGANVIKVESLDGGDNQRQSRYRIQDIGTVFLALNRNKESLAIDLKQPQGQEIARKLAYDADVLVENFRPGVMQRLGIGYEDLREQNPRLIYASISGFGQTGPYKDKKGQDSIAQAWSGLADRIGARDDPPTLAGAFSPADFSAAMFLCQGILVSIIARERTGKGQYIETNLLDCALFPQLVDVLTLINMGEMKKRAPRGGSRPLAGPTAGLYRAKDGYIVIQMEFLNNPVRRMCKILGLPDLSADSQFDSSDKVLRNFEVLRDIFADELRQKTVTEWIDLFEKAGGMCAPVKTLEEACCDPQVIHNGLIIDVSLPKGGSIKAIGNPLKMQKTPWKLRLGPPELGAQTTKILLRLGYTKEGIFQMKKNKVVG